MNNVMNFAFQNCMVLYWHFIILYFMIIFYEKCVKNNDIDVEN